MASVLFLENPSITTRTGEVMRRVEVSGEDLSIVTLDEADGNPTVSYDIGAYAAEVAQIDGTADVTLRLVLVENEVAVYWRQTFLYSAFRQGIFAIEGDEILQWCDGSAGFTSIGHGVEPIRTRTRRPDQPAH